MSTHSELLSGIETTIDITPVQSVGKAIAIVEVLIRSSEPLSAKAIADQIGVNRTTTHRFLRALMQLGWIEKPATGAVYRLSVRFLALAQLATQSRNVMAEIRPELEQLSRLTRETVHVGIRNGHEVVHIDRIDSLERVGVASKIGSRAELHTTGLGKALLAAEPETYLEEYIAGVVKRDVTSSFDLPAFRREIALTRARGFSIDDEDDSVGVRCLGVAVLGADGAPLFAISITGPSPRFTREHVNTYSPEAIRIAQKISSNFGWNGELVAQHAD